MDLTQSVADALERTIDGAQAAAVAALLALLLWVAVLLWMNR